MSKPPPSSRPTAAPSASPPHTTLEDVAAIVTGVLLVSVGVAFFKQAGLVTGGMAYRRHLIDSWAKADASVMINIGRAVFNTCHIAQINRTPGNALNDGRAHFVR